MFYTDPLLNVCLRRTDPVKVLYRISRGKTKVLYS